MWCLFQPFSQREKPNLKAFIAPKLHSGCEVLYLKPFGLHQTCLLLVGSYNAILNSLSLAGHCKRPGSSFMTACLENNMFPPLLTLGGGKPHLALWSLFQYFINTVALSHCPTQCFEWIWILVLLNKVNILAYIRVHGLVVCRSVDVHSSQTIWFGFRYVIVEARASDKALHHSPSVSDSPYITWKCVWGHWSVGKQMMVPLNTNQMGWHVSTEWCG